MLSVTRRAKDAVAKLWPPIGARCHQAQEWARRNPRTALWIGSAIVAVVLLVLLITHWNPYKAQHEAFAPIFTLVAGLAIAGVTLMRHFAQTEADRQRRITESFSKAVEQLGSDKLEVRLGGIYSLERISKESPDDYWTVMENLTAFARERSQRNEAERTRDLEQRVSRRAYFHWQEAGQPEGQAEAFWTRAEFEEFREPAPDIAAVLRVIKRRGEQSREREGTNGWRYDLSDAVLRRAHFQGVHLEGANLMNAHLERAILLDAHLEGASLIGAHLEGAILVGAHLERAFLLNSHLKRANLLGAHLEEPPSPSTGIPATTQWACRKQNFATPTSTPGPNFRRPDGGHGKPKRTIPFIGASPPASPASAAIICLPPQSAQP